jgi:hypothetical protein
LQASIAKKYGVFPDQLNSRTGELSGKPEYAKPVAEESGKE